MREHPLDRQMRLARVGRPEHGDEARGVVLGRGPWNVGVGASALWARRKEVAVGRLGAPVHQAFEISTMGASVKAEPPPPRMIVG
jgi:hypothetical protein